MNLFELFAKIDVDTTAFVKGMETVGKAAGVALGAASAAVTAFAGSAVKTGMQFDKSMSQVQATMLKTSEEMENEVGSVDTAFGHFQGNLREFAQFLGKNTAFSATQAADALNYMALAGYTTQESMEMLPNVLSLAAAGGFDLARASDMVTDAQTAFGIDAKRTTQMVDEMAKAASTGNTSVEQLGDAFLTIGGLAKELNNGFVELEDGTKAEVDGIQELEIALTAMANAGVKGSEAGTHMRNMLLKLSSPTDEGTKMLESLGVAVFDAEGNMRSLREIMGDLGSELGELTQEEKIQAISALFNTRDMASAEALLAAIDQDWDDIGASILDAEGSASKMADIQLDNLAGDVTLFKSALEGTQIAISDYLTPTLRDFVQMGTEGLGEITDALIEGDWAGAAEKLGDVVSQGASVITEKLPLIVEAGGQMLTGLISGFADNADAIAEGVASTVTAIVDFFANNIGTFIEGAMTIATSIASELIANIPQILEGIGTGILNGLAAIGENLNSMVMGIVESIWDLFGDFDGVPDSYYEDLDALLKKNDELTESWEKTKEARDNTFSDTSEEFGYYSSLLEELGLITDANGHVKQGYEERAEFILGQLSEAYGVESELIGGVITNYDQMAEAAQKAIEQKRAELQLAAEEEAYSEALKSRGEVVEQITELEGKMSEAVSARDELITSAAARTELAGYRVIASSEEQAQAMLLNWANEKSGLEELQAQHQQLSDSLVEMYDAEAQYMSDYSLYKQGKYEEVGKVTQKYTATEEASVEERIAAKKKEQRELEITLEAMKNATAGSGISESMIAETQKMLDGVNSDLDALETQYKTSMDNVNASAKTGAEGINFTMKTNSTNVTAGIRDTMTTATGVITGNLHTLTKDMSDAALNAVEGYTGSLKDGIGDVQDAAENIGDETIKSTKQALDSNSPSKKMQQIGEDAVSGLVNGLNAKTATAIQAMQKLISDVLAKGNNVYSSFYTIGDNMISGLIDGFKDRSSELSNIAKKAVEDALAAAKKAGDIKSPSRKMAWVGEMFAKGLEEGISNNAYLAITAATDMAEGINDAIGLTSEPLDFAEPEVTASLSADNYKEAVIDIAARLDRLEDSLYNVIADAISDSVHIEWNERELARMVKEYA